MLANVRVWWSETFPSSCMGTFVKNISVTKKVFGVYVFVLFNAKVMFVNKSKVASNRNVLLLF